MSDKNCAICLVGIENEEAPVLTMGAYGNPRFLCDCCAEHIEVMTRGRDYGEITASMDAVTDRMSRANIDDKITVSTVTELLVASAKRASQIKDGTYDFSLDEEEEEDYEIPEDMKETEEDRALDEKEKRQIEKFDKIMNFFWLGAILGFIAFILYFLIF